jgi:hypothetical protein
MKLTTPSPLTRLAILLLTAVLTWLPTSQLHASIDESHDFAMEAALPFVSQGFIVREDYWNGEVKSGQKLMVRHQFFKGNEYAFWLGTANEGCKLEVQVLDDKGNRIDIETKEGVGNHFTSVRVNPPRSGTYSIVFSISSKKEASVFWALAYGFR